MENKQELANEAIKILGSEIRYYQVFYRFINQQDDSLMNAYIDPTYKNLYYPGAIITNEANIEFLIIKVGPIYYE